MAALSAMLALAGCSSGGSSSPSTTAGSQSAGTSTTSSSSGSATTAASPGSSTTNSVPGSTTTIPYDPSKNARQDVTTTGPCDQVRGSWVLHGSVKNPTSSAHSYEIVVDFVTQPGDTVLDTKIVDTASIQPGHVAAWHTTGAAGQTNVACIIRQAQTR